MFFLQQQQSSEAATLHPRRHLPAPPVSRLSPTYLLVYFPHPSTHADLIARLNRAFEPISASLNDLPRDLDRLNEAIADS